MLTANTKGPSVRFLFELLASRTHHLCSIHGLQATRSANPSLRPILSRSWDPWQPPSPWLSSKHPFISARGSEASIIHSHDVIIHIFTD